MKTFRYGYILLVLVLLVPILAVYSCNQIRWRYGNYPIELYGVVLDEEDNPVPNVPIKAEIMASDYLIIKITGMPIIKFLYKRVYRKTDKDGLFRIKGYYGEKLNINTPLIKKGYEHIIRATPTSFDYIPTEPPSPIKHDPDNPFVYRMRKFGETTYLMEYSGWRNQAYFDTNDTDSKIEYFDIIKKINFGPNRLLDYDKKPLTRDLKISANWEAPNNRWAITFAPGTEIGGIQISNKKLYMAPETGYKPEVTFYVYLRYDEHYAWSIYLKDSPDEPFGPEIQGDEKQGDDKYYFYLKSRDSNLYSRISIRLPRFGNENGIHEVLLHDISFTTNPYAGERCLDMEPNIPGKLEIALLDEARSAFYKNPNARIPAPDLPARIRAYGGRAAGDKR